MSRLGSIGLLVLASLWPMRHGYSATYYVDYSAGADGNDGTAGAPFRHCPGDTAATGRAAAALAPGDTVVFKGGVTYEGFVDCRRDGVTYDGNSAGSFGQGRAVIRGRDNSARIRGFTAVGRTGLVFRDLVLERYGGHGSLPWTGTENRGRYGYAIYLDGCSKVAVTHCLFRDIGDWENVALANEGYMEGVGVAVIDSGNAVTIADNEFTRIGRAGIMVQPKEGRQSCTDISIRGNDFHSYLRWGVWLATGNSRCTLNDVTIEGNRFHDFYQYAMGQWRGRARAAPHVDCIIAYVGSIPPQGGQVLGTAAHPITIRNNFFYNDATVARVQNSAVMLDTWGGRVLIYNNVFINVLYNGNGAIFCLEGTDTSINPPPDYWIANNTFYDSIYAVTLESSLYPLKRGSVRILNNIFCKPDAGAGYSVRVMDAGSTPAQLDYNLYYTGRSDQCLVRLPSGTETLAQLRRFGYERHGRQADPRFRNRSFGLGVASGSNDLRLRADSPAIDAAFNLSSLFSADGDNRARPASAAWDCGAFQHGAAPE